MKRIHLVALALVGMIFRTQAAEAQRKVTLDDLYRLRDVSEPQVSPDGEWVAYTVAAADTARDRSDQDIWMTSWDGKRTLRLTWSSAGEHAPRFSPDGRYLAFLSDRNDPHESDQVWLLDRSGGEAERVTDLAGGVSDYAWSPDGTRLALIGTTEADSAQSDDSTKKAPPPVVIDRLQFKQDKVGWVGIHPEHLMLFDLATRKAEVLMPGDDAERAPSWSPDGRSIAFVGRRGEAADRSNNWDLYVIAARPGSAPRRLTTFEGADMDPDWGSRAPAWSPDGSRIAYLQGGPPRMIYYAVQKLAVVPVAGGAPRVLTPALDRNVLSPTWSPDGSSLLSLVEDDRTYHLARIGAEGGPPERLLDGRHYVGDLALGGQGHVAVTVTTATAPNEVFALDGKELRPLSRQNQPWLAEVRMAPEEEISFRSRDGTEIHGFMMKPPDYTPGRRYPTVLRIHGGPVWQLYHDFDFTWQLLAAEGYVVVGANPRGSSGRGEKFSYAIWADWGNKDVQDVLAAVDYAVSQGVADPARLGVGGWSYGGILTNHVIARDTRFKAAISGAGQSNVLAGYGTDQYVREYEAELGQPWKTPKVWERVSYPFFHADRIVTPTLFMCGDADWNVPLLNSEQMYQALRSLGRKTELVVYPGEPHEIGRPSHQRDRLARYLAWYGKYLGVAAGPAAATSTGR